MCAKKKPVLILDPSTELRFKDVTCELKITNPTDKQVCFKLKTTAPNQYAVNPNMGLLLPQETRIISIKFHPQLDSNEVPEGAHRFMVQHVILPPGETTTNVKDMWKSTKKEDIMILILKCIFEKDNSDTSKKAVQNVELQSSSTKQDDTMMSTMEVVSQKPVEDFKTVKQEKKISEKHIESESNKIKRLENEKEALIQANERLSKEVARLMSVDNERDHYKGQLQKKDNELNNLKLLLDKKEQVLQTTEITLTTFREDFEAERKDRENAHNIKEEEIRKAREEMKKNKAEFDKRFYDTKQSLEAQVAKQQKQLEKQQIQLEKIEKSKQEVMQKYQETLETNKNLKSRIEELEDKIKELEGKIKEADESLRITKLIDLNRDIGEGGNGVVKEVLLHGKICAAKVVHKLLVQSVGKKQFEYTKQKFLKECEIYSKLVHPNIVQFLGIYYPSPDDVLPWIVMERLASSLTSFLKDFNQEQVVLYVKISLLHDVTLGIQYLHNKGIIHRDLSSNNILLTRDLQAKIADYGVAKLVDPTIVKTHTQAPGTTIFMPPETLVLKPRYGTGVDVFSFGCIMIHMMTHQLPIPIDQVQTDPVSQEMKALSEIERRENYLKSMKSFPLLTLTKKCLSNDSQSRPSANKILVEVAQLLATFETENSIDLYVQYTMEIQKLKTMLSERENRITKLNETLAALQNK